MNQDYRQDSATRRRGDTVKEVRLAGHRVRVSASRESGFTLIELVVTLTVITILTMGAIPLVKVAVRRQREQELRETLRTIRAAIDEFHRDTLGMNCSGGTGTTVNPTAAPVIDPRSRVMISDCTIFGVDNPDRYPPDLQTLVSGVNVIPRVPTITGGAGLSGSTGTALSQTSSTKTKTYLRAIPIDPITGKAEWDLRSCYDTADSDSTGGENVFDVRSKSRDTALNGEKYRDW
jgi:general secretion pathway protein G